VSDYHECKYRKLLEIERRVNILTFKVYGLGMQCLEPKLINILNEGLELERDLGEI
jgi:hypothetical protein